MKKVLLMARLESPNWDSLILEFAKLEIAHIGMAQIGNSLNWKSLTWKRDLTISGNRDFRRKGKINAYQECAEVNHYVPLPLQSNVALRLNNENVLTFHGSILAAFSDNYDHLSQKFLKDVSLLDNQKNNGRQKPKVTSHDVAANELQPQQSIQASNSRPNVVLDCCSSASKCSKLTLLTVNYVFEFLYEGTLGITFANVPHLLEAASFFGLTELKNLLGQIILHYAEGNPDRYIPICLHMCFDHNLSEQFKEAVVKKALGHLPQMIRTLNSRKDGKAEKERNHNCSLVLSLYEASIPMEDFVNWQILKFEFIINWLRRNPRHSPIYARGLINASCDFDKIDLNTAFYCLDKASIAGGLHFFIRNRIVKAFWSKVRRKSVVGLSLSAASGGGNGRRQGSSKTPVSKETIELIVRTFKGQQMQPPGANITLPAESTEENSTKERSNRVLEEFPNLLNKRGRTLFVSRIEQPNFAVQVCKFLRIMTSLLRIFRMENFTLFQFINFYSIMIVVRGLTQLLK
uniref:BTB domain-containing protein n=1 Tax=Romanomermis culicivorax TaxID=13658 RepID=A0A915I6I6_ROMCU